MSVIKASLKGHGFGRSLRWLLPTSESSPSFPATLDSHPGSPSALMQRGILKQAVYIKRSTGGGHHAENVAEDKECIRATTAWKHKHTADTQRNTPLCIFFFLPVFPRILPSYAGTHSLHAHTSTNINSVTGKKNTRYREAQSRLGKG